VTPVRVLAAAALAAAVTVVPIAGPGPVSGAGAHPAAPGQEPPAVGLELIDQTTWHGEDGVFEAQVRPGRAPADATVQLVVHNRLLSRSDFHRTLFGVLGGTAHQAPALPLAALPRSADGVVSLQLPVGDGGAGIDEPGVYPVAVVVAASDGTTLGTLVTHLAVLPPDEWYPPLSVAVLLDISSPPTLRPDGQTEIGPTTISRAEERAEVLAGTEGVPISLAPRPETLDGLARHDDRGATLIDDLASGSGRPVLARPYTEIDLAALDAAELLREANNQAEAGADVVRRRFGTEPVGGIWFGDETVGARASRLLVELGIGRAVVPPSAVSDVPDADGRVPQVPARLDEGGPAALITDPGLGDRLVSDGILGGQHAVAELAMIWFERPAIERGIVVHVPPDAAMDVDAVSRALRTLDASHAVDVVPLDRLFDVPVGEEGPRVVTSAPHTPTGSLTGIASTLAEARDRVGGYGTTVDDDAAGQSLEASLLLATGSTTPDSERGAYVSRVATQLGALADDIHAPAEFRITLTSRSSTIPLNISNDSDQPVSVRIDLDSSRLDFPDGTEIQTTLQPGVTRLDVRVQARTSGAFPLDITITSPDGAIELDRTTFDIRSTAVTGVGLLLSIGAGLFLLVWWGRHWRTSRRSQHLVAPGGAIGSGPAGSGGEGAADDDAGHPLAHMARPMPATADVHDAPAGRDPSFGPTRAERGGTVH
jgi:hypothetical protein